MSANAFGAVLALLAALVGPACGSGQQDQGCVDIAGVWNLSRVTQSGTLTCDNPGFAWTISQAGCDVMITASPSDPANGAEGRVAGNRFYVEWSWNWDCLLVDEWIDATVDDTQMSGQYGLIRAPTVFPIPPGCVGSGTCSAALSGVRQAP